jgi:hypothetical protein
MNKDVLRVFKLLASLGHSLASLGHSLGTTEYYSDFFQNHMSTM